MNALTPSPAANRPRSRARTTWTRSFALAGGALLAGACAPEDPALAEGRALYEVNCEVCHGESAVGDGPMAASLPVPPVSLIEHLAHHPSAEMYRLVTEGIPPAMPPHTLSQEQVGRIVEYVWTLVPEDRVAELRALQLRVEELGAPAAGMPGMDHSQMPGMDHSRMPGMSGDSTGDSAPDR